MDGKPLARPRTILIDSAQLESGEGMKADFKEAAAAEIAAFKAEYRRRNPGADVDKITDEELLREVMNTVGKTGRLGEQVRCVVSVSMLTEGWDANTVTHILGVRAFGSQLLCEQVVGRGLRRRIVRRERTRADCSSPSTRTSTASRSSSSPPTARSRTRCRRSRSQQVAASRAVSTCGSRSRSSTATGSSCPTSEIWLDLDERRPSRSAATRCPAGSTWAASSAGPKLRRATPPSTGPSRSPSRSPSGSSMRTSTPSTTSGPGCSPARRDCAGSGSSRRSWWPEAITIGYLMTITEARVLAAEKIWDAITYQAGNRRERLRPMINRFDPAGSTGEVDFMTRKAVVAAEKSEVSHVTLDGKTGNTWEQLLAESSSTTRTSRLT